MAHYAGVPYTLVSFHAHPDDEALLTAGTLARAVAEGHRTVLVTATAGGAGLASRTAAGDDLAGRRLDELHRSAAALGCAAVHVLGYDDSGMDGLAGRDGHAFARVSVDDAAARLADVLRAERADVLTVYDPVGGYGHPDHVQVHRVGIRAAELAGTPVVLQATVDRTALLRALRLLGAVTRLPADWRADRFRDAYVPRAALTHRVDVRPYLVRKRAAMAAHASQATADGGDRTLARFLRLPRPLYRLAFGREWYVERGRVPGARPLDDVFATLRGRQDTVGHGGRLGGAQEEGH